MTLFPEEEVPGFPVVDSGNPGRTAEAVAEWIADRVPVALLSRVASSLVRIAEAREEAGIPEAEELETVVRWWNALAAEKLVPHTVTRRMGKYSEEIVRAWRVFVTRPDLQTMLRDLPAVEAEIRRSRLCRTGWFRLEKLLRGAVNKDSCQILKKLVEGGFRDDEKTTSGRGSGFRDGLREFVGD